MQALKGKLAKKLQGCTAGKRALFNFMTLNRPQSVIINNKEYIIRGKHQC